MIVAWKFGGRRRRDVADTRRRRRSRGTSARRSRAAASSLTRHATARHVSSRCAAARGTGAVALPGHARARARRSRSIGRQLWLYVRRAAGVRVTLAGKAVALPARRQACRSSSTPTTTAPRQRLDAARARVIVVTGSELVRGERTDLNGPFLARELAAARARAGADRDRRRRRRTSSRRRSGKGSPRDLLRRLRRARADARRPHGRARRARARASSSSSTTSSSGEIEAVSRAVAERLRRDYADFAPGVTKQATLPEGARLARARGHGAGPRARARRRPRRRRAARAARRAAAALAARARDRSRCGALLARTRPPGRRVLRLFGVERVGGRARARGGGRRRRRGRGDDLRPRLRDPRRPRRRARAPRRARTRSRRRSRAPLEQWLFAQRRAGGRGASCSTLCRARGLTLATAESCTGGLVAARLTSVPGSSDVFLGGVVAYANEVKEARARRSGGAARASTAPSRPRSAAAMAAGARERLGADVAVSVTGIAGPGGGTPEKPVGLVYLHAEGPDGGHGVRVQLPGRPRRRSARGGRRRAPPRAAASDTES